MLTAALSEAERRATSKGVALLRRNDEVRAPIRGVRLFITRRVERKLLAVAHRPHPRGGNAERYEIVACHQRTPLTQGEVVFGRSPLVAMPFDGDLPIAILFQDA